MLAGRSNVGKSTLLNALVGSKVASVSPKPQTTRRPVRGILHDARGQIVFVDTPGIFLGKKDPLSERLNKYVQQETEGIDAIVYVVDPTRAPGAEEEHLQKLLRKLPTPIILVINKIDLDADKIPYLETAKHIDVGQKTTLELSALDAKHLPRLVNALFDLLPIGPAYYPEGQLTDLAHLEWLSELIREKAFFHLEEELPYSIMAEVTDVQERKNGDRFIAASIFTTDERYKKMIIGHRAQMIKAIGSDVRKELEIALNQRVFLDLKVEVDPSWPQRFSSR